MSPANILQAPPLTDPSLLFDDVFFNPFVIQIMNAWVSPYVRDFACLIDSI